MCDKAVALETLRERRKFWIECLCGSDVHSIQNQIFQMLWADVVFRTINEARKMAPQDKNGGLKLNAMMFRAYDAGYVQGQMIAIRKLWSDPSPSDGKKGVNSLRALISDMTKHANLLTRENLFLVSELDYDTTKQKQAYEQFVSQQTLGQVHIIPREFQWGKSDGYHKEIDILSGVTCNARKPDDTVSVKVFDFLKRKMDSVIGPEFKMLVDKFVAHASTRESRLEIENREFKITLDFIEKAHKTIWRTAKFLESSLLTGNRSFIFPTVIFDQFQYIDRPLVVSNNIPKIQEYWQSYENQINALREWDDDTIRQAVIG